MVFIFFFCSFSFCFSFYFSFFGQFLLASWQILFGLNQFLISFRTRNWFDFKYLPFGRREEPTPKPKWMGNWGNSGKICMRLWLRGKRRKGKGGGRGGARALKVLKYLCPLWWITEENTMKLNKNIAIYNNRLPRPDPLNKTCTLKEKVVLN